TTRTPATSLGVHAELLEQRRRRRRKRHAALEKRVDIACRLSPVMREMDVTLLEEEERLRRRVPDASELRIRRIDRLERDDLRPNRSVRDDELERSIFEDEVRLRVRPRLLVNVLELERELCELVACAYALLEPAWSTRATS